MKDIHSNSLSRKSQRTTVATNNKYCLYNYEGVNYSVSKEKPHEIHSFDEVELDLSMGNLYASFTAHNKPRKFLIPQEEGEFQLKVTFTSSAYGFIKKLHGTETMEGDVYLYRKGEEKPVSVAKTTYVANKLVCEFPLVKMKPGEYFLLIKHLSPFFNRCKAFKQIVKDIWAINFEVAHTPYKFVSIYHTDEFISIYHTGEGGVGWMLKDRETERAKSNILRMVDIVKRKLGSYKLEQLKELEHALENICKDEW